MKFKTHQHQGQVLDLPNDAQVNIGWIPMDPDAEKALALERQKKLDNLAKRDPILFAKLHPEDAAKRGIPTRKEYVAAGFDPADYEQHVRIMLRRKPPAPPPAPEAKPVPPPPAATPADTQTQPAAPPPAASEPEAAVPPADLHEAPKS